MSILLVILIVIFASASSFIPSLAKGLIDNRRRGLKRVKPSGWATIVCYVFTVALTYFQFQHNENENKRKELKADSTQTVRDANQRRTYDSSLVQMKNKFDTSNIKVVNAFGEALGKYGLKFDSANAQLVKIVRDSSKAQTILPNPPVLTFAYGEEISLKECDSTICQYNIGIGSYDAGSTNFNIKSEILVLDNMLNIHYLDFVKPLGTRQKMSANQRNIIGITVESKVKYIALYIRLHGSYTDLYNKNVYSVDIIYAYNPKEKSGGPVGGPRKAEILNLLKRQNL